jgi:aminoglycoside phosphotransferase (APT) family kinase protein
MAKSKMTEDDVKAFLDDHFGESVDNVELLGAGDWSRAFSFDHEGRALVARFGKYREDFEMDRLAMAFGRPGLPVPRVLDIGHAFEESFAISERHVGRFLDSIGVDETDELAPGVLRLLDALREIPVDQNASAQWPGDDPHLSWHDWLTTSVVDDGNERVGGWRKELSKAPEIEALYTRSVQEMLALVGDVPATLHVVHRDLLNRNVLVDDGCEVTAVYDWGCSVFGDYLFDVAWFTFWAPWMKGVGQLDMAELVRSHHRDTGVDVTNFDVRLRCYELQIGAEHLAYQTVMNDPEERVKVAQRLNEVLESNG